jgi:Na+/phosphate symporter
MKDKQLLYQLHQKDKQISDLYALIDTLQTNLRTAVNYLSEDDKEKVVNVQSYKWSSSWKQGDELK